MNEFVGALIGLAGAMGVPVFLTAVAESTAAKLEHALPTRARVIARRRQVLLKFDPLEGARAGGIAAARARGASL